MKDIITRLEVADMLIRRRDGKAYDVAWAYGLDLERARRQSWFRFAVAEVAS